MPGEGEILVKVEACGVCHTDKCAQFNYLGGGFPIIAGYEFSLTLFTVAVFCTLRAEAVVRIPSDIDAIKAAPLCAGSTPGVRTRHKGWAALDILLSKHANRMGYRVIAVSRGSSKAVAAHSLKLGVAHVAFTTALDAEAFKPLNRGLRILGTLVVVSVPGEIQLSHTDSEDAAAFTVRCGVECWVETRRLEEVQEAYSEYLRTCTGK
ncbi:alcohol dehydrogenase GroES-like domain-containing protein [Rostrohypoxylon terebratum]|nr:alcohol dehydrogenase GroES-like domain-containing protein [Rostrohypoxylon terebratum]